MASPNDERFVKELAADMARLGPPVDVASYRKFLHDLLEERKNGGPLPEVARYISGHALGGHLRADIAVPFGAGPFPVALISHGNGGLAGSPHSYRRFTRDVAALGFLAITPDYRLAPEYRHPAALEDMIAAAQWAFTGAESLGGDTGRVVLIGDSSGAGIGLATLLRLQTMPEPHRFRAFVGLEGAYDRLQKGFITDAYMPEGYTEEDARDPSASPIFAIQAETALPPLLLLTGSRDMLAGRTMQLATRLWECNHAFALHLLEGMPHDFMKFPALDGSREGHRIMAEFLRTAIS